MVNSVIMMMTSDDALKAVRKRDGSDVIWLKRGRRTILGASDNDYTRIRIRTGLIYDQSQVLAALTRVKQPKKKAQHRHFQ